MSTNPKNEVATAVHWLFQLKKTQNKEGIRGTLRSGPYVLTSTQDLKWTLPSDNRFSGFLHTRTCYQHPWALIQKFRAHSLWLYRPTITGYQSHRAQQAVHIKFPERLSSRPRADVGRQAVNRSFVPWFFASNGFASYRCNYSRLYMWRTSASFVRFYIAITNLLDIGNTARELSESLSSGFSPKVTKLVPNADIGTSWAPVCLVPGNTFLRGWEHTAFFASCSDAPRDPPSLIWLTSLSWQSSHLDSRAKMLGEGLTWRIHGFRA